MDIFHSKPVTFLFLPRTELTTIVQPPNQQRSGVEANTHVLFRGAEQSSDLCAGLEDGHVPLRQVFCDFEPATTERSGSKVGGVI